MIEFILGLMAGTFIAITFVRATQGMTDDEEEEYDDSIDVRLDIEKTDNLYLLYENNGYFKYQSDNLHDMVDKIVELYGGTKINIHTPQLDDVEKELIVKRISKHLHLK